MISSSVISTIQAARVPKNEMRRISPGVRRKRLASSDGAPHSAIAGSAASSSPNASGKRQK